MSEVRIIQFDFVPNSSSFLSKFHVWWQNIWRNFNKSKITQSSWNELMHVLLGSSKNTHNAFSSTSHFFVSPSFLRTCFFAVQAIWTVIPLEHLWKGLTRYIGNSLMMWIKVFGKPVCYESAYIMLIPTRNRHYLVFRLVTWLNYKRSEMEKAMNKWTNELARGPV